MESADRALALTIAALLVLGAAALPAAPPSPGRPQPLAFSKELLPTVVEMVRWAAVAASGTPHAPHYALIALGKDEYVYSLQDRTFIRVIKGKYELPPWQLCGDWASVRIALLGPSMEASAPETIWFLAYRDGHWERVYRNESGAFTREGHPAQVPPYAVRCFNLDRRDLTD